MGLYIVILFIGFVGGGVTVFLWIAWPILVIKWRIRRRKNNHTSTWKTLQQIRHQTLTTPVNADSYLQKAHQELVVSFHLRHIQRENAYAEIQQRLSAPHCMELYNAYISAASALQQPTREQLATIAKPIVEAWEQELALLDTQWKGETEPPGNTPVA